MIFYPSTLSLLETVEGRLRDDHPPTEHEAAWWYAALAREHAWLSAQTTFGYTAHDEARDRLTRLDHAQDDISARIDDRLLVALHDAEGVYASQIELAYRALWSMRRVAPEIVDDAREIVSAGRVAS